MRMQVTAQREGSGFRRRFIRLSRGLASLAVLLVLSSGLLADDDNDTFPGLLVHYRAGGRTVTRIDPDVAFQWKTDSPICDFPAAPLPLRGRVSFSSGREARFAFTHISREK